MIKVQKIPPDIIYLFIIFFLFAKHFLEYYILLHSNNMVNIQ